jgi:aminomethyltransferase
MATAKRTVLFELHQRLGARMTEFAGFQMPVSYRGIIEEHLAVRCHAGVFDVSHMGEFELSGPGALTLLERALTNSAARLREGQAQYSILCNERGGVIDDVIVYRLAADRYMLCVNASNITHDLEWLRSLDTAGRAGLRDISDDTALIAIQGPAAVSIIQQLAEFQLESIPRFGVMQAQVAGLRCILARTGYTGEDGFEIFLPTESAPKMFEALLASGSPSGMLPCGLGARDTLRMEAGLPLYDHELDADTTPLEAGLGAFVKLGRDFVGEPALAHQRRLGTRKRLIGIRTEDGKSIARQGHKLQLDGREVGIVTSGTYAPSLGRPLAMAYVRDHDSVAAIGEGQMLAVAIRQRHVDARVVALPFYRRGQRAAASI